MARTKYTLVQYARKLGKSTAQLTATDLYNYYGGKVPRRKGGKGAAKKG